MGVVSGRLGSFAADRPTSYATARSRGAPARLPRSNRTGPRDLRRFVGAREPRGSLREPRGSVQGASERRASVRLGVLGGVSASRSGSVSSAGERQRTFFDSQTILIVWHTSRIVCQRKSLVSQTSAVVWETTWIVWQTSAVVSKTTAVMTKTTGVVWKTGALLRQSSGRVWQSSSVVWQTSGSRLAIVWGRLAIVKSALAVGMAVLASVGGAGGGDAGGLEDGKLLTMSRAGVRGASEVGSDPRTCAHARSPRASCRGTGRP